MLVEFFQQYLHQEKAKLITDGFQAKKLKKGSKFVREGAITSNIGFIEKGLARSFFKNHENRENTICFMGEGMMLLDPFSYYASRPSRFTIEFLEDSLVHVCDKSTIEQLYRKDHEINTLGRKFAEESYIFMLERIMERESELAPERYKKLMNNPLFHRIPLKHLASYLGITDSSLSRIRKQIQ